MTKLSIFEYSDYKKFLIDWIDQGPQKGRGLRKQLAEAIGCQTAFITHVLSGNYHLSLEQAEASSRWLGLNDPESRFLILLVLLKRAGTKSLENMIRKQISELREEQAILKDRVNIQETLSIEDQTIYYSSWHYAAIHMALLNPNLRSVDGLQKYFQLTTAKIISVLDFLLERGLIKKEKNIYKVNKPVLHLELNSPLLTQHHTHWRLKAIESMSNKTFENLHYSGVISLSKDDYEWVRERLSQLLKEIIDKLNSSPDEQLACLNFDWFQI